MKQRDLELLSSYLDGQLKPSDSARLQARLSSDPDLRAVLDDLRAARGLLRQLPMRKALPQLHTLRRRWWERIRPCAPILASDLSLLWQPSCSSLQLG
jgi:anti-sigma factor RsiW